MNTKKANFSKWKKWENIKELLGLKFPGVYIISKSSKNIEGNPFNFIKEIIYIGMTNSKSGLRNRLKQFEDTFLGKRDNHGGAQRARFKYKTKNRHHILSNFYIAARSFECNVASNTAADLCIMGKVAEYEYVCMAEHVKRFKKLPEFNDKKRSPKK